MSLKKDNEIKNIKIVKNILDERKNLGLIGKSTYDTQYYRLLPFARYLHDKKIDILKPNEEDIIQYLPRLDDGTKITFIQTLRTFYKTHYKLDKYDKLPEFIRRISIKQWKKNKFQDKEIQNRDKLITEEEYNQLLSKCTQIREKAIIETLWYYGIRKSELRNLKSKDYKQEKPFHILTVRKSKTKPRDVEITEYPQYLEEYHSTYQPNKNEPDKPLFPSPRDNNKILSNRAINTIIERLTKKSEIKKHITVHDFRHTAISRDLSNGMYETDVKTKYGLSKNSLMLAVYDHNGNKQLRENLLKKPIPTDETRRRMKAENEDYRKAIEQLKNDVNFYKNKEKSLKGMKEEINKLNKSRNEQDDNFKNLKREMKDYQDILADTMIINLEYMKKDIKEGNTNFWSKRKDKLEEAIKILNDK